jgi:hypothetical protein
MAVQEASCLSFEISAFADYCCQVDVQHFQRDGFCKIFLLEQPDLQANQLFEIFHLGSSRQPSETLGAAMLRNKALPEDCQRQLKRKLLGSAGVFDCRPPPAKRRDNPLVVQHRECPPHRVTWVVSPCCAATKWRKVGTRENMPSFHPDGISAFAMRIWGCLRRAARLQAKSAYLSENLTTDQGPAWQSQPLR